MIKPPKPQNIPDSFIVTIQESQGQLQQTKKLLGTVIDNLEHAPSSFNYLTQKWHQYSLMRKIFTASFISTPLLLLGITLHVAVLTALGCALCLFVGVNIYLFENHKSQMQFNTQQLKKPIESIINLLETVMGTLSATSILLATELKTLQETNIKVTEECDKLVKERDNLNLANNNLKNDASSLNQLNENMIKTINTTEQTVREQQQKLENCQKSLDETIAIYQNNQKELSFKISEINELKEALAKKAEHVQKLSEALSKTISSFTQMTLTDEHNRIEFLDKFNQLLQHQEATLNNVAQNIAKTGEEFALTVQGIKDNDTRFKNLVDRQEQVLIKLETIPLKAPVNHGIFSQAKPTITEQQAGLILSC